MTRREQYETSSTCTCRSFPDRLCGCHLDFVAHRDCSCDCPPSSATRGWQRDAPDWPDWLTDDYIGALMTIASTDPKQVRRAAELIGTPAADAVLGAERMAETIRRLEQ